MRNLVAVLVLASCVLASCSSTTSSNGKAECFTGSYTVTYGAASEGSPCPDLTSLHPTLTYAVQGGQVSGSEPANSTANAGNTFDENTCKAHAGFTSTKTPDPGCTAETFVFDMTFSGSGFTGTYVFTGCANASDGGATTVNLTCTFPISGTKQ